MLCLLKVENMKKKREVPLHFHTVGNSVFYSAFIPVYYDWRWAIIQKSHIGIT